MAEEQSSAQSLRSHEPPSNDTDDAVVRSTGAGQTEIMTTQPIPDSIPSQELEPEANLPDQHLPTEPAAPLPSAETLSHDAKTDEIVGAQVLVPPPSDVQDGHPSSADPSDALFLDQPVEASSEPPTQAGAMLGNLNVPADPNLGEPQQVESEISNAPALDIQPVDQADGVDLDWMNTGDSTVGIESPTTGVTSMSTETLLDHIQEPTTLDLAEQADVLETRESEISVTEAATPSSAQGAVPVELTAASSPGDATPFPEPDTNSNEATSNVIDHTFESSWNEIEATTANNLSDEWEQTLQTGSEKDTMSALEPSIEASEGQKAADNLSSSVDFPSSAEFPALGNATQASGPAQDIASDNPFGTDGETGSMPWEVDEISRGVAGAGAPGLESSGQSNDDMGFGFSDNNPEESSLDWANEIGLSSGEQAVQVPTTETKQDTANIPESMDEKSIEDSWAKAFASPDTDLNDSWSAAFGAAFEDEDGLLEDPVKDSAPLSQPSTALNPPVASAHIPTQAPPAPTRTMTTSAYTAAPPIASSVGAQAAPSTPMQFFEELPIAPSRARRPRPQTPTQTPPSAPPPPGQSRQAAPVASPPRPAQFRQPDRMDPFPPEPSVPVASHASSYSTAAPTAPQPTPPASSRYSPASNVPPSAAVPPSAQNQPPLSSKYTSAQPSSGPPPGPSRSPYAPPPAAPNARSGKSSYSVSPPSTSAALPPRPFPPHAPTQGVSQAMGNSQAPPMPMGHPTQQPGPIPGVISSSNIAQQAAHAPTPPAPPPANRFAPRTSSPLAQQDYRPNVQRSTTVPSQSPNDQAGDYADVQLRNQSLAHVISAPSGTDGGQYESMPGPPASNIPSRTPRSAAYSPPPPSQPQRDAFATMPPQRRPQTSSPSDTSRIAPVPLVERASSAHAQPPIIANGGQMPHSVPTNPSTDFVLPSDETALDPLQRWKGTPIFHWGAGGVIVKSLPTHVPRFGGGQTAPKMKPLAGEVKLQRAKDLLSHQDELPPFPGPLKSKGKKKDVTNWLTTVISNLEKQLQSSVTDGVPTADWTRLEERTILWKVMKILVEYDGALSGNPAVGTAAREALKPAPSTPLTSTNPVVHPAVPAATKAIDPGAVSELKKLLLGGDREKAIWYAVDNQLWAHAMVLAPSAGPVVWKQVVQEFVKNEVRSTEADNQSLSALYQVLAGNWDECIDELVPLSARSGFQMVSTTATPSQTRDAFEGLNKWRETLTLILCNRSHDDEHAILSLGKLLAASGRIEAAHVCYLFSRSCAHFGGADDPQTVLALIGVNHNNPWSNGGVEIEAIQLSEVYEFALSLSATGSSGHSPHLQAYKLQHALSLAESGLRTEALLYCDAITAAMKSSTRMSAYNNPTLVAQVDDLQKRLSQSPKDGTSSWISKPTIGKVSSSMGTWFTSWVAGDEVDGASTGSGHQSEGDAGPFARMPGGTPIVSRSGSSVDLHASYSAQQPPAAGSSASRYAPAAYAPRASHEDLRGQGSYAPSYSSSPELRQGQYAPRQATDTPSSSYGSPPATSHFARQPSHLSQYQSYSPQSRPDSSSSSVPRPANFNEPYVPTVQEEQPPPAYPAAYGRADEQQPADAVLGHDVDRKTNGYTANGYNPNGMGYQPSAPVDEPQNVGYQAFGGYEPPSGSYEPSSGSYEPPSGGYDPSGGGYEPSNEATESMQGGYEPPTGGYEPPSYQPYQPYQPEEASGTAPRKGMMDDDADELAAAELKKKEKAQRDKEAEDAFRAAAEADAARDKEKKRNTSGWFGGIGGLFGGKKDPNAPVVHKAKLGEENSFYYDNETKKWVNRKATGSSPSPGASSTASAPPPPRSSAPPSRNVSAAGGPPMSSSPAPPLPSGESSLKPPLPGFPPRDSSFSGPSSRAATPASSADPTAGEAPESSSSPPQPPSVEAAAMPSADSGPPSAPQSRPPTSMSGASSLDDLMGAPQARKGGTIKKGKKGQRYVDVMAK